MYYVIHAYDAPDDGALARRMAVRPDHLAGVRRLKSRGEFILGGALLNEAGDMIGSMMLVQFDTRADLDAWLEIEPYRTEGIWEKIDVRPFRIAEV